MPINPHEKKERKKLLQIWIISGHVVEPSDNNRVRQHKVQVLSHYQLPKIN